MVAPDVAPPIAHVRQHLGGRTTPTQGADFHLELSGGDLPGEDRRAGPQLLGGVVHLLGGSAQTE
jgi:hypothetical protein